MAVDNVAAGELIESAWGNTVATDVNALMAQRPLGFGGNNMGADTAVPTGVWSRRQTWAFTAPIAGQYLVIVTATVWPGASGGSVALLPGMDGIIASAAAPSKADCVAGSSASLSNTVLASVTAGAHMLDAYGWTNGASGGTMGSSQAVAVFIHV